MLTIVIGFSLGRWNIADGFEQAMVVEPGHLLQRGQLHGFLALPGRTAMNQLGLVKAVDGLDQGVVICLLGYPPTPRHRPRPSARCIEC